MEYTRIKDAPVDTPWGKPDTRTEIAPGIVAYTTPSHGGIWLDKWRVAEMPAELSSRTFTKSPHWYEEDCDWAMVATAFPQFFTEEQQGMAKRTMAWLNKTKLAAAS